MDSLLDYGILKQGRRNTVLPTENAAETETDAKQTDQKRNKKTAISEKKETASGKQNSERPI